MLILEEDDVSRRLDFDISILQAGGEVDMYVNKSVVDTFRTYGHDQSVGG